MVKLFWAAAILITAISVEAQNHVPTASAGSSETTLPNRTSELIRIWPGAAPGAESWTGPEVEQDGVVDAGPIRVKTNVTVPMMEVVRPEPGKSNNTAMLVLPGGAFMALAWDLEGTEVAHWLAERGITAFILKYRVGSLQLEPGQSAPTDLDELIRLLEPHRRLAVADAGEAIRIVRRQAASFDVDPQRIGMIGFSAGAITTLGVLLEGDAGSRPDFAASIYGMLLTAGDPPVPANAPPLFIAHAQDDEVVPVDRSLRVFDKWNMAGKPAELHVYPDGGHGFGMRQKDKSVGPWPQALEAWLGFNGLLTPVATSGLHSSGGVEAGRTADPG